MSELYCILGSEYRLRLELAAFLARHGFGDDDLNIGLLVPSVVADHPDFANWLPTKYSFAVLRADWREDEGWLTEQDLDTFDILLLLPDRALPVVDQMESMRPWMEQYGCTLGRIFTVIDCATLKKVFPVG